MQLDFVEDNGAFSTTSLQYFQSLELENDVHGNVSMEEICREVAIEISSRLSIRIVADDQAHSKDEDIESLDY